MVVHRPTTLGNRRAKQYELKKSFTRPHRPLGSRRVIMGKHIHLKVKRITGKIRNPRHSITPGSYLKVTKWRASHPHKTTKHLRLNRIKKPTIKRWARHGGKFTPR